MAMKHPELAPAILRNNCTESDRLHHDAQIFNFVVADLSRFYNLWDVEDLFYLFDLSAV